jgi:general nucleoside transport system ATP-binding protein
MTAGPGDPHQARVEMRGMVKRFGATQALRGVDFTLGGGDIHGLLGENGAGKTTLMNVLSGLYRADAGTIAIDGRPVEIRAPADALAHGIGMVHQHVELIATFTGLENILLGSEGSAWRLRLDRRRADVEAIARRFGLPVALDTAVGSLAAGVQQKIEILKALYRGVDVLILDEPTTMLTPQEVDGLFASLRTLAEGGVTVVFITHKIREILANCDRVTVMRGGAAVATIDRASATEGHLVELMIGARTVETTARDDVGPAAASRASVLEARGLTVTDVGRVRLVSGCDLVVRAGEVVGVAGVAGNGQRELAEAIVGARPAAGSLRVAGREVAGASIRDRIAAGLVYIPEDRIHDGILPGLSLAENLVLGLHPYAFARPRSAGGAARPAAGVTASFKRRVAGDLARQAIAEYGIQAAGAEARAVELSGGNIQKVLVARAMALARLTHGVALVATNPTRGLDVRATAFVRARLLDFARGEGGVLLISEDLDELLQVCDRIAVMYRGAIMADVPRAEFDRYRIGALMAGAR